MRLEAAQGASSKGAQAGTALAPPCGLPTQNSPIDHISDIVRFTDAALYGHRPGVVRDFFPAEASLD